MATVTKTIPLLRSQKNLLLELVQREGLDPREFRFEETASHVQDHTHIERMLHVPSGGYFDFDFTEKQTHYCAFSPGAERHQELHHPGPWTGILDLVQRWLVYLHREITEPDMWAQLTDGGNLLNAVAEVGDDRPFSEHELRQLSAGLAEVREYLRLAIPPDEFTRVNARLDVLEASAATQTRQAWAIFAIGQVVSMVWSGMLAPEQARAIFDAVGRAFQQLLGA